MMNPQLNKYWAWKGGCAVKILSCPYQRVEIPSIYCQTNWLRKKPLVPCYSRSESLVTQKSSLLAAGLPFSRHWKLPRLRNRQLKNFERRVRNFILKPYLRLFTRMLQIKGKPIALRGHKKIPLRFVSKETVVRWRCRSIGALRQLIAIARSMTPFFLMMMRRSRPCSANKSSIQTRSHQLCKSLLHQRKETKIKLQITPCLQSQKW